MSSIAFTLLHLIFLAMAPTNSAVTKIGVTFSASDSDPGSLLPSPDKFLEKVNSRKIQAVRLISFYPAMIRAFADSKVTVLLSIPNPTVPRLASSRSLARLWVNRHVLPFYPRTKISIVSVGTNAISHSLDISPFLLEAMQNVHISLTELQIYDISVSTTFVFYEIVPAFFPPWEAKFHKQHIITPVLQFLERTESPFLISLSPYDVLRLTSSFARKMGRTLLNESPWRQIEDESTGRMYHGLWDVMVDSVIHSMAVTGHDNLSLIVMDTTSPSSGELYVTLLQSNMFLKALVSHLGRNLSSVSEVYLPDFPAKTEEVNVPVVWVLWGIPVVWIFATCLVIAVIVTVSVAAAFYLGRPVVWIFVACLVIVTVSVAAAFYPGAFKTSLLIVKFLVSVGKLFVWVTKLMK